MPSDDAKARTILRQLFAAAIASADPMQVVSAHLPEKPKGRCIVVGAGKASAAMAAALELAWPHVAMSGVVVTRYGHAVPTQKIRIIEAAHPVPDHNSLEAARLILKAVHGLSADDLVIALVSGGGSALLVSPAGGMTLADKQDINRQLLHSGASIHEMNAVRRRFSRIKGGKLARAASPARVVTLVISDVPGDDPAIIASGPTVNDPFTHADVMAIVERYVLKLPSAALEVLAEDAAAPSMPPIIEDVRMIASPAKALAAAEALAKSLGFNPLILGDALEGEAREVGKVLAGIAQSVRHHGQPVPTPAILLSGGETTVSIEKGSVGRGGRNTEFLLSAALSLNGCTGMWALAGDTDGIDGTEDAAGAIIAPDSLRRAKELGLDARSILSTHNSYHFFEALGDLVITGPTLTNVNDFRAILIMK